MNASPPSDPRAEKEHFRYLDALRGIAVLGVVLVHCTLLSQQQGFRQDLAYNEQKGVQLFYMISAFTLCHSWTVRQENERHSLRNYFIRRFFRIAPLFYLAVLGNLLIHGLSANLAAPFGLHPFEVVLGLLFLNGLDPNAINSVAMGGWSVAVETMFYLVLPLILWSITSFRQSFILLICSALAAPAFSYWCYHIVQQPLWWDYFSYLWFPIEFPVFCMGVSAYFYWKEHLRAKKSERRTLLSLGLLVGALLLFFVNQVTVKSAIYPPCLAFVPLILALALHEWRFLVNRATVFLGRISYSVYLTQFFCLLVIGPLWPHFERASGWRLTGTLLGLFIAFIWVLLFTTPLSILTYYLVEKPGIRFGRRLIQRNEKGVIPARL